MSLNTKHFPTSHGKNGGGGGVTYINGGGGVGTDLNVNTINANKGRIGELTGASLVYNDGNFLYVGASDGTISKLKGNDLNYQYGFFNSLEADDVTVNGKITTNDLKATTAFIEALSSKEITTEYLTVTKSAHFFELIIDKVKSVGGSMMMTCANSIIDYVKAYDANNNEVTLDANDAKYYKVWFRATDSDGRQISNDWQEGDQAICQSFNNITGPGTYYDVSNKYYWRLVEATLDDKYINFNTGEEMAIGPQGPQGNINANEVEIINPYITWTPGSQGVETIQGPWVAEAQQTAIWVGTQGMQGTQGTLTTFNTIFGVQFSPDHKPDTSTTSTDFTPYDIEIATPQTFGFQCSNARLNVGLFYTDGKYDYFPAPASPQTTYSYNLPNANNAIQSVIISNADEVAWRLCHGIQLSNTVKDSNAYDGPQGPQGCQGSTLFNDASSIPSSGDNIIQLGNRGTQGHQADPERQSAIIIAAYRSPDNGNPNGTPPLGPIQAPSYAQYVGINDFNLGAHRHTYIDRNGSVFKGNMYTEGGSSIEQMINDVSTTNTIYVAYMTQAQKDYNDLHPSGPYQFDWGDSTTNPSSPFDPNKTYSYIGMVASPAASQSGVSYNDYEWIFIPGGASASGTSIATAYKNVQMAGPQGPDVPPAGTKIYPGGPQYNGWTATAETPDFANGYYTWMTQCTVQGGTPSSTATFGTWGSPSRITGDNGKDGEDGNITEFIYKSFAGPQTFSGLDDPHNWTYAQDPDINNRDYLGPQGHEWNDNPTGVSESIQYEYMSQRTYLGPQAGMQWTQFTEPVVWSHWGHEGRDGDGYEYIFYVSGNVNPSTGEPIAPGLYYPSTDINGKTILQDEYLPATKSNPSYASGSTDWWHDNPQTVTLGAPYQWVAMRKKIQGEWGMQGGVQGGFTSPSIWGTYGIGEPGAQGPQGTPGDAEDLYNILDMGSVSNIKTYVVDTPGVGFDIKQRLRCIFNFRIVKVEGGIPHVMTYNEVINHPALGTNSLTVDGLYLYMRLPQYYNNSSGRSYKWVMLDVNPSVSGYPNTDAVFSFEEYWENGAAGPQGNIHDYKTTKWVDDDNIMEMFSNVQFRLIPGAQAGNFYANGTNIENYKFTYNGNQGAFYLDNLASALDRALDTYTRPTILDTQAIHAVLDAEIVNLVRGMQGQQAITSQLVIGLQGVQAGVQSIANDYVTESELTIGLQGIQTEVKQGYMDVMTNGNSTVIDLTSYDANTYHPVSIIMKWKTYTGDAVGMDGEKRDGYRFVIERPLDASYGTPSWAEHAQGFSICLDWSVINGAWGGNWHAGSLNPPIDTYIGNQGIMRSGWKINEVDTHLDTEKFGTDYDTSYRHINKYEYLYTNGVPVLGDIRQNSETGEEIIFLRGGSKYNLHSSYWPKRQSDGVYLPLSSIVKIWNTSLGSSSYGYDSSVTSHDIDPSSTSYNTRKAARFTTSVDVINKVQPEVDAMRYSQISQTANEISMSVNAGTVNQLRSTGIDITDGKIYLQGDNVIFGDSTGGHQGNVWIDNTNGTLGAQGAEIGGTIKAKTFYNTPIDPYDTADSSGDVTLSEANGNLSSLYLCKTSSYGGPSTIFAKMPIANDYKGMQIQAFKPKALTGAFIKTYRFYTNNYGGFVINAVGENNAKSATYIYLPAGTLITMLSVNGYWYVTGYEFNSNEYGT